MSGTLIKTGNAILEIYYPDGSRETYEQTVYAEAPYDQWFGVQLNTEGNEVKELNFFNEADVIALMEWDTDVDLDITVYDQYNELVGSKWGITMKRVKKVIAGLILLGCY